MPYKTWQASHLDTDRQKYKISKSATKQTVAEAKAHYTEIYCHLDTPEGVNKIFCLTRARHCASQDISHVINIKSVDGKLLQDPISILQRWNDYFAKICNEEFPHPPLPDAEPVLGPALKKGPAAEVKEAIEKMKNGR